MLSIIIKNDFFFWSFRYNLMFSLTGGGKYNFHGTKRWIEENLDHAGECSGFGTNALSNMSEVVYI